VTQNTYHTYSGCIWFKSLHPKVLRILGSSHFKPDTTLVDMI